MGSTHSLTEIDSVADRQVDQKTMDGQMDGLLRQADDGHSYNHLSASLWGFNHLSDSTL